MSNTRKQASKKPSTAIKIMIKLGWNNQRIPVTTRTFREKSKLAEIIQELSPDIQKEISNCREEEPVLIYARESIRRSEWDGMNLGALGIRNGSVLLTLNLCSGLTAGSGPVSPPAPEPMQVEKPEVKPRTPQMAPAPAPVKVEGPMTCEMALQTILSSHFDADAKECVVTLIKVLDNVIGKPGDERTRNIRLGNANFHKKVASKSGGVEFLLACGFTLTGFTSNRSLILTPQNESLPTLLSSRTLLQTCAVQQLQIPTSQIPPIPSTPTPTPPPPPPSFDIYKTRSFNTQAAAAGANPNSVSSTDGEAYVSSTEKQLRTLNAKVQRIEKSMQDRGLDRCLSASRPGDGVVATVQEEGEGDVKDGALLAQRMKRLQDEKKQRDNAGFTTKAMRDLEKLKKTKVYSHTQLRISFPDGYSLSAKFLPSETISQVKQVIRSALTQHPEFDLYITPPRYVLNQDKTLQEEQLVPAARVFVSWKGASPTGTYIKQNLFAVSTEMAFPDGKNVVSSSEEREKKGADEDALMKKMMGKSSMASSSGSKKSEKKGFSKLKWFKG